MLASPRFGFPARFGRGSRFGRCRHEGAVAEPGVTVAHLLQRAMALAPVGMVVVDSLRNVVVFNDRAVELAWYATRCSTTGSGRRPSEPWQPATTWRSTLLRLGRACRALGLSVHGHSRLLRAEQPRYAVVYLDDQSEQARMEASRRDFVANVSHELKTPVAAMAVLAEALLESSDDPENRSAFRADAAHRVPTAGQHGRRIDRVVPATGAERLPNLVAVDVDTVVQEAISVTRWWPTTPKITITTDAPQGLRYSGIRDCWSPRWLT